MYFVKTSGIYKIPISILGDAPILPKATCGENFYLVAEGSGEKERYTMIFQTRNGNAVFEGSSREAYLRYWRINDGIPEYTDEIPVSPSLFQGALTLCLSYINNAEDKNSKKSKKSD
jgi:hypothetical protein